MSVQAISREEAIWLAAMYDAEGWFSASWCKQQKKHLGKRLMINIGLCNNNPYIMKKASELVCRLGCRFWWRLKKSKNGWVLDFVVAGNKSAEKLLRAIAPHLLAKREQAKCLLEYIEAKRAAYESPHVFARGEHKKMAPRNPAILALERVVWQRMRELNARRFNLQRLPRRASQPLTLERLEVMV